MPGTYLAIYCLQRDDQLDLDRYNRQWAGQWPAGVRFKPLASEGTMKTKIVIVVAGGCVTGVYCSAKDASVRILDYDVRDEHELHDYVEPEHTKAMTTLHPIFED